MLNTLAHCWNQTVFRFVDTFNQHSERLVAVKTLSLRRATDWKVIELFEREAQVLAQLQHPQIPRYVDYFSIDSLENRAFYIVQELAIGESLFQRVEQGWHATGAEVKAIAVQVLQVLIYLHNFEPPIVHRDLKPHNLIWCKDNDQKDGQIMLVDFARCAIPTTTRYEFSSLSQIYLHTHLLKHFLE